MMEKSSRPQRNRRHSRRAWPPEDDLHHARTAKRLFTPEIKRMLKEWLIRRRENPYPSRDEKKRLAYETGLTYTQICNWFANWRRKLKNSERERAKKSWGHLIKNYNTNAKGNVEQFSITSEDSIWEEDEELLLRRSDDESRNENSMDGGSELSKQWQYYEPICKSKSCAETYTMQRCGVADNWQPTTTQCSRYSAHTTIASEGKANVQNTPTNKTKYKQKIMEKYLRDTEQTHVMEDGAEIQVALEVEVEVAQQNATNTHHPTVKEGAELSKWLESAVKFTPNKNNYFIEFYDRSNKFERQQQSKATHRCSNNNAARGSAETERHAYDTIHHKDELDAAEALANLAFNCRQRMLDVTAMQC